MKKLRIYYPWAETPVEGSFFVPAVNAAQIKHEGLVAALHLRIKAKAVTGLLNGRHGVLFTRRP